MRSTGPKIAKVVNTATPFIIGFGVLLLLVIMYLQQRILQQTREKHEMYSWLVWLQAIPLINVVMTYIAANRVSRALSLFGSPATDHFAGSIKTLGVITGHATVMMTAGFYCSMYDYGLKVITVVWVFFWLLLLRNYMGWLQEVRGALSEKRLSQQTEEPAVQNSTSVMSASDNGETKTGGTFQGLEIIAFLNVFTVVFGLFILAGPFFYRGEMLLIGLIVYIIILWLVYIDCQKNFLNCAGPECRTIQPGYIMVQLVPLFNFIFSYIMAGHVAWSAKILVGERGGKTNEIVRDLGFAVCHMAIIAPVVLVIIVLPAYASYFSFFWFAAFLLFWTVLIKKYIWELNAAAATGVPAQTSEATETSDASDEPDEAEASPGGDQHE